MALCRQCDEWNIKSKCEMIQVGGHIRDTKYQQVKKPCCRYKMIYSVKSHLRDQHDYLSSRDGLKFYPRLSIKHVTTNAIPHNQCELIPRHYVRFTEETCECLVPCHDDIMAWKHCLHYCPFVKGKPLVTGGFPSQRASSENGWYLSEWSADTDSSCHQLIYGHHVKLIKDRHRHGICFFFNKIFSFCRHLQ